MRYAIKQLSELTTADLGAVMMPRAGARIIRRQSKAFTHDNIAKLAKYRQSVGHSRPNLDPLELIATRIETGKLVLIRIPAPLVSSVGSPSGNVNHLLPRALANKVHALAELTLVEDIEHHIRNENSVNQSGGYTSDTAVAASNSSSAAAVSRTMANAATAPVTAPIKESITLNYDYVDGQPIEDIPYIVNHAGDIYEGVLSAGRALISDVDAGSYSVEYKAVDENEIVTLRKELKTNLDGMIAEVKAKAKIQEELIEKESYVMQGLIYSGAFFTGLYESGSSIASGLVEAVESGAEFAFDVGAACWRLLTLLGTGDLAGLRREFEEIAKQGGETFDAIKDCFKTLYIIAMDGESRSMLADFPEAYFDAHSSVEKKRLVGKLAFEIIFAIATFGAGAAVSAIAKSKYFVKAGQALQDITKHIKLEKLNHKRDGTTNDDVLDEAERIDDELVLIASANMGDLQHAQKLISELPEGIRGNYRVHTNADGKVIVVRKDGNSPPKLRYVNGELVTASDNISVFATIKEKLNISHADLKPDEIKELKSLEADRNLAVAKRDKALLSGDDVALKVAQQEMRNASERIGESAGRIYVGNNYPNAKPLDAGLLNNSKQGQFDQIYQDGDKIIVIEAKGGGATWGSKKVGEDTAQQGSKKYLDSTIKNYNDILEEASNDPRLDAPGHEAFTAKVDKLEKTVAALNKAAEKEMNSTTKGQYIEYIGVKQKVTDSGLKESIDIFKFDLGS